MQKTYHDITKEYPDKYRVMIYKTPYTPKPRTKEIIKKMNFNLEDSLARSVRRTRRTLHDYVGCNDFDLFVTFTFNPKKVSRYDVDSTFAKMNSWLWYQKHKNPEMKYLVVPERHKDGAIHFHALMQNTTFYLKKTNVIQDSRRVYNIGAFRYGFTTATYLPKDDNNAKGRAGNYIAKYITKDMVIIRGRHRYVASRNLEKPVKHINALYDLGLNNSIDITTKTYETDFNVGYEISRV